MQIILMSYDARFIEFIKLVGKKRKCSASLSLKLLTRIFVQMISLNGVMSL